METVSGDLPFNRRIRTVLHSLCQPKMAIWLFGDFMIGKFVKSILKLGFCAVGLCGVVGTWDYTRQAKAAGYDYSLDAYRLSVVDRYGAEATIAFAMMDMSKAGAMRGIAAIDQAGLLSKVGLAMPERTLALTEPAAPGHVPDILASAATSLAPEISLYPRARVLR